MPSPPDLQTLLDRLGVQAQECRKLIKEMHECQQDLHSELREARVVIVQLKKAAHETAQGEIKAILEGEVTRQLDELGKQTEKAMADTTEKIFKEFETLTGPMLETLGLVDIALELHESKKQRG